MAFFVAIDEIAQNVDDEVSEFRQDRDKFIRTLRDAAKDVAPKVQKAGARGPASGQKRRTAS